MGLRKGCLGVLAGAGVPAPQHLSACSFVQGPTQPTLPATLHTLFHPPRLGAVVGNAQPELVQWVLEQPQEARMVVTDAAMARGILEGLARHGLY